MTKEFQFIYRGLPFSSEDKRFNWHKFTCTLDRLLDNSLNQLTHLHSTCELIAKRQYTGLKDVSGTKVFEGDVIQIPGIGVCEVIWSCLGWAFRVDEYAYDFQDVIEDIGECKILGNIHENPELIKGVVSDEK